MANSTIKALCFDVFGTVTDWRSSVIKACQKTTEKLNLDVNWGEFVDKWRVDGYIAALIKIATGQMEIQPIEVIHLNKLLKAIRKAGHLSIPGLRHPA